jgi:hypothetical protein
MLGCSDCWIAGLSDYRIIGLLDTCFSNARYSDSRITGLLEDSRIAGCSDYWMFGLLDVRIAGLSDYWRPEKGDRRPEGV